MSRAAGGRALVGTKKGRAEALPLRALVPTPSSHARRRRDPS